MTQDYYIALVDTWLWAKYGSLNEVLNKLGTTSDGRLASEMSTNLPSSKLDFSLLIEAAYQLRRQYERRYRVTL